jgi:hypothetical protein
MAGWFESSKLYYLIKSPFVANLYGHCCVKFDENFSISSAEYDTDPLPEHVAALKESKCDEMEQNPNAQTGKAIFFFI